MTEPEAPADPQEQVSRWTDPEGTEIRISSGWICPICGVIHKSKQAALDCDEGHGEYQLAEAIRCCEREKARASQAEVILAGLVADLYEHADGNVGDGCWDLHDKYVALLDLIQKGKV